MISLMSNRENNTALITIDVQEGFRDLYWGPRNNPRCEENIETLLGLWRVQGWPVVHVQHSSLEEESPLRPDRKGFAFMDFVNPQQGETLVSKTVNSAFIGTDLEKSLKLNRISALVFVGLTSDHCVSTSCRMASNLGFDCKIVADATATFERRMKDKVFPAELVHHVSLASLSGEFAKIVSTKDLLGH